MIASTSSSDSPRGSLLHLLQTFSKTLFNWTPLLMLFGYCITSFSVYNLLPNTAHEVIWYIFIILQTFTSLSVVAEAVSSLRPTVLARRDMRKAYKNGFQLEEGQEWPHIDLILVAYLPNEEEIIMKQIRYATSRIEYPSDKLTINIVYNTPKPMAIEQDLRALEDEHDNVRVIKVFNSTSKAENINHFLSLSGCKGEIITIYDTDHYPETTALSWVAKRFLSGEVDIIQGRCCTYNYSESWTTSMVAAEFDMIYGVMHLGRAELHGYGFFGGSNGHWNASLLRTLKMRPEMLTEDIDSSLRAIISGARIEYNVRVISYELAPVTLPALARQRARWSQGWSQVAIKHAIPALRRGAYSDGNGWRSKLGLLQLLLYREVYFYINSQLFWLLISSICTVLPRQGFSVFFKNFGGFSLAMWALAINLLCLVMTMAITARNRSHFTKPFGILIFSFIISFYYIGVSHMAIFCHFREFTRYSKWNATKRGIARKDAASPS